MPIPGRSWRIRSESFHPMTSTRSDCSPLAVLSSGWMRRPEGTACTASTTSIRESFEIVSGVACTSNPEGGIVDLTSRSPASKRACLPSQRPTSPSMRTIARSLLG